MIATSAADRQRSISHAANAMHNAAIVVMNQPNDSCWTLISVHQSRRFGTWLGRRPASAKALHTVTPAAATPHTSAHTALRRTAR
jgi:hypothetical protein